METSRDVLSMAQDVSAMKSLLLVILEALDTGVWPKAFLMFNDLWIEDVKSGIAKTLKGKYGVSVPDSEL